MTDIEPRTVNLAKAMFRMDFRPEQNADPANGPDDAVQEALIAFWRSGLTVDDRAYQIGAMRLRIRSHIYENKVFGRPHNKSGRGKSRVPFTMRNYYDEPGLNPHDPSETRWDMVRSAERDPADIAVDRDTVARAFATVTAPAPREAVYRQYILGQDAAQIAEEMGISAKSARNYVHRGLTTMREAMVS